MIGYFTFNGKSSKDFSIFIDKYDSFKTADRDYESVAIDGRSGELTIDHGRYKNVDVAYQCGIGINFASKYNEFTAWLMKHLDYQKLTDSFRPDVYRMARVKSAPDPDVFPGRKGGTFEVVFDCKPQKWLVSGDTEITVGTSQSVTNPTPYPSYPLLTITGSGNLYIGGKTITITGNPGTMIMDCEIGDAYSAYGHTNYNQYVTENSLAMTTIPAGASTITHSSGMTVKMKPRWWTL